MRNIFKFITASALSLALFTGCIKETMPTDGLTAEQMQNYLPQMASGIPLAMIQTYAAGLGQHFDFGYPSLMIVRDAFLEDLCPQGEPGYNWFSAYFQNMGQGYSDGYNQIFWNCYYPWIKGCNDVINLAKASLATEQNADKIAEIEQSLGMAYAYRAMFYQELAATFIYKANEFAPAEGPIEGLTVPLVLETTTEADAKNNPRADRDVMYAQILDDLDLAEQYLAGKNPADITVPTLAVAYGLKARTYLAMGEYDEANYAEAAKYARLAIDESGCTPLTQEQWHSTSSGFNDAGSQNSWMWGLIQTSENVSNLISWTGWMTSEQTWGYTSHYFGFLSFTADKNFYEMIPETDFRKYSYIDPKRGDFYDYAICYADAADFLENCFDYASLKFRPASGNTMDYKTGNATDIPMMRVEEMYLIEAEATAYSNLAKAKTLLADFMSYRILDGSYDMGAVASEEDFVLEVMKQKRIELWGEGRMFFDYKRLGLGIERGYPGTLWLSSLQYNCEEVAPWWNVTIPLSEFQNNPGLGDSSTMNNPNPTGTVAPEKY